MHQVGFIYKIIFLYLIHGNKLVHRSVVVVIATGKYLYMVVLPFMTFCSNMNSTLLSAIRVNTLSLCTICMFMAVVKLKALPTEKCINKINTNFFHV